MGGDAGAGIKRMAAGQSQTHVRNEGIFPAKESFCGAAGFARADVAEFDPYSIRAIFARTASAREKRAAHQRRKKFGENEVDLFRAEFGSGSAGCVVVAEPSVRAGEIRNRGNGRLRIAIH